LGPHRFVSRVTNNLDGEPPREISLETVVLGKEETKAVRENETVVALLSNVQIGAILLIGLTDDGNSKDGTTTMTSGKELRGWLLRNDGTPGGVGALYSSAGPPPPSGFREGIVAKDTAGSVCINEERLWAEWWRVANEGTQAKYGVECIPIEGSLVLERKNKKWTRLTIDFHMRMKDGSQVTYSGTITWERLHLVIEEWDEPLKNAVKTAPEEQ
jgi:hypothetical protein